MTVTRLKKLHIEKFRALNNVDIEFGESITLLCGKNGVSKSSILGIAAQIFSFRTDYESGRLLSSLRQITGKIFKSKYSEHFRISEKFDRPGSMAVDIELYDGYTGQDAKAKLELMKRGKLPRPVVRNNSTVGKKRGNTSRNFTHPVIFLGLKRLVPIASRRYKIAHYDYLMSHKEDFVRLSNALLNREFSSATGTGGTISSAVAHGGNYDQDSVSAGEDNAGQIILALMSFRKLQEEYADYKGGLLLIDEADAGLFPRAQVNLFRVLEKECKKLNLQVVMTSHSPTLINCVRQRSQQDGSGYKAIFLSDTYGSVKVMRDWSWEQFDADIHVKTVPARDGKKLPKVNVYFEDKEAADFFAALMFEQPIEQFITPFPNVRLGCSNYKNLIREGVPEFSEKSVVCLDADAIQEFKKEFKEEMPRTVVFLPGHLPPDRLIFEYLCSLPADDDFWKNEFQFTRPVFIGNAGHSVIEKFHIAPGEKVDIKAAVDASKGGEEKARVAFKNFYKDAEFQRLVASPSKPCNPWRHWIEHNPEACNEFLQKFKQALHGVMSTCYTLDASALAALKVNLKGA